jgi:hypothetical protein
MIHLTLAGQEHRKRISRRRNRRRSRRSGLAMAMAMMLGSLLAVLLAVSATRTHAAKIQQRRAAEAMQLEQMRLAAMLRLHHAANESPSGDPKGVIEWNPELLPLDVTDASDLPERITKGWRVIARFAEAKATGPRTTGPRTTGEAVTSDSGKRDRIVEVVSAYSRQKWIGRLDLEGDGKSTERSRDDRQRDSRNESEVP